MRILEMSNTHTSKYGSNEKQKQASRNLLDKFGEYKFVQGGVGKGKSKEVGENNDLSCYDKERKCQTFVNRKLYISISGCETQNGDQHE